MRAAWIGVAILVAASGCGLGTQTPPRDQVRPYDLVPQSGYLAEGPTVRADYEAPSAADGDGVEYDEVVYDEVVYDETAYRAAIRKDLARIGALLAENEELRQELAVAKTALNEARDEIEVLRRDIARLERAEARAARGVPPAGDEK